MKKLIIALIILSLIFIGSLIIFNMKEESINEDESISSGETEKVYQGPVRPTDDEAYFRKTGITRPLNSSK